MAARVGQSMAINTEHCSLLESFDLLQPLNFKMDADGGPVATTDLFSLKIKEFQDLEESSFMELRKKNALDTVYAHLYSMDCFSVLVRLLQLRRKKGDSLKDLGLKIFDNKEEELDFNLL
jgi:hypothetical protein